MVKKSSIYKTAVPQAFIFSLLSLTILTRLSYADAEYEEATRSDLNKQGKSLAPLLEPTKEKAVYFNGELSSYLAYAVKNSPKLRAMFERWRALVASISKSRRLPDPMVTFGLYVLSIETRVGPQRARIGLKQTFPWPTKLTAGADAASAKARAAQRRFDAQTLDLKARVAKAYWELWLVRQIISVQKKVLDVARGSSEAVRARLVLGMASLSDSQQIELFVARLEDAIETNIVKESSHASNLVFELGAPPGTKTPTIGFSTDSGLPMEDLESIKRAALLHPSIEAFELEAQSAEAQARKARAGRLPDLTLGVDWIATGESEMMDPPPDSGRDALIVGVGLSLPIWQSGYKDDEEAALAQAGAFEAEKQYASQKVLAELDAVLANITNTHRSIELHKSTLIPQAETALESVIGAYSTSRSTVAAVLMAERSLLDLQIALVQASALHETSWAELERRVGREVERASRIEAKE